MRINNVSAETSVQTVAIMSVFTSVITIGLVWAYITSSFNGCSLFGFFQWLFDIFQTMRSEMTDEPFFPWFILIAFISLYVGFIGSIISRYNAIVRFNRELNVRYINLLLEGVEFCFNRPENNFKCAYEEIENLFMDINSKLVRTKNSSYIAFQQLNLVFTTSNGKKYKLSNTTSSPMKLIYKIIDWTRKVQKFEYDFSGYGEISDYREKINEYLQLGYKYLIGKESEAKFKVLSIVFFIMGIIFLFGFQDLLKFSVKYSGFDSGVIFTLIMLSILIIISFIFDIILIVDKIRDNKYRGYNYTNGIMQKISIWHILIFKAISIAIIIYLFFLPLLTK